MSLLLLLSEGIVFIAEAGSPQRSARWDAFLSQPRPKRSVTSWEGGGTSAICILQDLTVEDTLGRRTSGLLSPPHSAKGVVAVVGHLQLLTLTPITSL